jgi:uncharacterized protein YkwD
MSKLRVHSAWVVLCLAGASLCSCDPQTAGIGNLTSADPAVNSGIPIGSDPSSGTGNSSALTGTAALDSEEISFFHLINDYRVQNGLPTLQVSIALTESSDWMSQDMAAKNYFSHTDSLGRDPFTRMAAFGYNYSWAGENIAGGNADAQSTFTQWKNSAGHNANMLSSNYRVIGIARALGGVYGWTWTTDFGGTVDSTVAVP